MTWSGLAVIATSAAVLSFTSVRDLAAAAAYPDGLAPLLPVVIDATAVVGSRIWLGGQGTPGAVRYARALALTAAGVTITGNVLQHGLTAYHLAPAWWLIAALAAVPPAALVAVAHLVALLTRAPEPPSGRPDDPAVPTDHSTGEPVVGLAPTTHQSTSAAGEDLVSRASVIVAASPNKVGRARLARELAVTEHQARQVLAQLATHPATHTTNGARP